MHERDENASQFDAPWRIGVDIGGTFTDLVLVDRNGKTIECKASSTPLDPTIGFIDALRLIAQNINQTYETILANCERLVHGTTIATNTVLEGKGAKVGLLVTHGFRDILEIRRGIRENPWDHRTPFPEVLVPRSRRLPITERIGPSGEIFVPLDSSNVASAVEELRRHDVEAIAIAFLNSFANNRHELECAEQIRRLLPDAYVYCSAEASSVMGEYERTSTVALNSYIGPKIVPYLKRLQESLAKSGLPNPILLMQSNGGVISVEQVERNPAALLLSGPAAAASSLAHYGVALGSQDVISIEIGGTSCDVLLMNDDRAATTDHSSIAGYHLSLPTVDIHTVSAGGGTIAKLDPGGMVQVGPQGAGALPGPAAYGRGGTDPTVTDAQLILGRLNTGNYAGGAITLNADLAREALHRAFDISERDNVDETAAGIVRLMEQKVVHAVEKISIERGLDPSRFVLVAAGGAGPLHGASVARNLGCSRVFVPKRAGVFCAFGLCHADARHDLVRTFIEPLDRIDPARVATLFADLENTATRYLSTDGFHKDAMNFFRQIDLRYQGQQSTVSIDIRQIDSDELLSAFVERFQQLYGHDQGTGGIETVSLRLTAFGRISKSLDDKIDSATDPAKPFAQRTMWESTRGKRLEVPVYDEAALCAGHIIQGPALVETEITTILVPDGDRLTVDAFGNFDILVELEQ